MVPHLLGCEMHPQTGSRAGRAGRPAQVKPWSTHDRPERSGAWAALCHLLEFGSRAPPTGVTGGLRGHSASSQPMRSGKPVGLGPHFPGSTSRTPQAAPVSLRRPGALTEDRLPSVGESPSSS